MNFDPQYLATYFDNAVQGFTPEEAAPAPDGPELGAGM